MLKCKVSRHLLANQVKKSQCIRFVFEQIVRAIPVDFPNRHQTRFNKLSNKYFLSNRATVLTRQMKRNHIRDKKYTAARKESCRTKDKDTSFLPTILTMFYLIIISTQNINLILCAQRVMCFSTTCSKTHLMRKIYSTHRRRKNLNRIFFNPINAALSSDWPNSPNQSSSQRQQNPIFTTPNPSKTTQQLKSYNTQNGLYIFLFRRRLFRPPNPISISISIPTPQTPIRTPTPNIRIPNPLNPPQPPNPPPRPNPPLPPPLQNRLHPPPNPPLLPAHPPPPPRPLGHPRPTHGPRHTHRRPRPNRRQNRRLRRRLQVLGKQRRPRPHPLHLPLHRKPDNRSTSPFPLPPSHMTPTYDMN